MKESIHFSDFDIRKGRIDFRCVHTCDGAIVKENDIFFELSEPILPSFDAIALACACMCGSSFGIIRLDIPVSPQMCSVIERFTKSMVVTLPGDASVQINIVPNNEPTVLLSFSGGTDCLAAMNLLPRKNIRLVSTDFAGDFERERIGYTLHNPEYLLKTNLRSLDYNLNHWSFMGIGTILFSEYAGATHFSFGSNLTDSIWHLVEKPVLARNGGATPPLPFGALGAGQVCLTNGIGGAAIQRLVTYYFPDILQQVFDSLALPGTQKRYHKELILQCVEKRFGGTIQYTPTEMRDTSSFGEIIETDLQLPYMLKHLDRQTLETFVSGIPQEIYDMAQKRQLTFYERFYPVFLQTIPAELQPFFLDRLQEAGIKQYMQVDYEDMLALGDFAWERYGK